MTKAQAFVVKTELKRKANTGVKHKIRFSQADFV